MEQQISFCKTAEGVSIAYSSMGHGPALVIVPGWISHLQLAWELPTAKSFLEKLIRYHTLISYDRYGCGLSERNRTDFSPESELRVLEAVVNHLKLKRFALWGFSNGGSYAVTYAVKHPRRVTHLIIYGAHALGETMVPDEVKPVFRSLILKAWGLGSKMFADLFLPDAGEDAAHWFTRLQREGATPEMAARLLDLAYEVNIIDLLPEVRVPTLVMHRRGDRAVPFRLGREMASLIPKAQFVPLEGSSHLFFCGDADSILRPMTEFLGDPVDAAPTMPTVEEFKRKLAAILSADVKGYSRLMGEDEAETVKTITAYRKIMVELIQQYRGRVIDSPGDNILAEFASVVDAVQCAIAAQNEFKTRNAELRENRRMEFRIGINLGDVIVEDERIYGDGVNIAARIEGLAEGGGICISGTAYDQVENKIGLSYEYLGQQTVKNIAKPVRVYRVLMEPGVKVHEVALERKAKPRQWPDELG